jgi:transposase
MRYEPSDYDWTAVKPLLPNKPRGAQRVNDRRVLNSIRRVSRSGAPWRDLPALSSFKLRLARFHDGAPALAIILAIHAGEADLFDRIHIASVGILQHLGNGDLGRLNRQRRVARDGTGDIQRRAPQLGVGHHAIDETSVTTSPYGPVGAYSGYDLGRTRTGPAKVRPYKKGFIGRARSRCLFAE